MDDAAILNHISRLPHARATFKQLVRELGSKGIGKEEIDAALDRLEARGEILQPRAGNFVVTRRNREFAVGRMVAHRDGFGFVVMDPPIEGIAGDLFLPPGEAGKAMHGDRVLARIQRIGREGRAEAEIVRILKRAHVEVVGEFRIRRNGNFVVPHDDRIRQWILIPPGMETPPAGDEGVHRVGARAVETHNPQELNGLIVVAHIVDYPDDEDWAIGRVVEVLGHADDFGIDVEIMIRKHHIPHRFPEDVLREAREAAQEPGEDALQGRRDFRAMEVVTIDGETARDFDDAVWVDRLPGGNYALHVHIADVGHYVRPGSAIDREARMRGTSVYFPDRAVPMLPAELSTDVCSLKPGVDRLVVSALAELDHNGELVSQEFTRGVIRSVERMTYTNVHLALDGDAAMCERYRTLLPRFQLMRELALILNRKRVRRGSIDFDLPEPLIEFDEFGEMTGVTRAPRNIAHRLIEEFMLVANEAVASHLENLDWPSIYRVHEKPDAKRVADFEQIAAHFGYSLGVGAIPVSRHRIVERRRDGRKVNRDVILEKEINVTSRQYQKLVAKIEGKPEERILSYLMLRSLKQARYSERNSGHFALAADTYTHFTSPIRRYPDLIVHRVLCARLAGKESPFSENELREVADDTSFTERRAAEAERELVEWKKLRFMIDKVGEEFDALIIQTVKFGFFVELENLFVEGLVPLDSIEGDRYLYQETTRKVVGARSKHAFSIGDRVRVCLDRVDAVEKKLQFSVVMNTSRRMGGKRR
ncbi:MAG: VacB/RNase II family 3'-5' exoribonuclease [Candidatus Solibacter usitatus]|nr:VacB/RNase II family 3'-5' exoribonuclease [Candidatus Solibacter usitatus]